MNIVVPETIANSVTNEIDWRARAVAAERERDALKIEMRRREQDGRRQLFSLMKTLGVTMDDLLEWQMRQDERVK